MRKRESEVTPSPRRSSRGGRTTPDPVPETADASAGRMVLEESLCRLVEQMPAGVIVAEAPGGRITLANQRLAQIHRRDWPGLALRDRYAALRGFYPDGSLYAPGDWPLARSLGRGDVVIGEVIEIERGDGTRGRIRVSSAPMRDSQGRTAGAVAVEVDVTEQALAEQALRESEERFRTLADNIPDVIARYDREGRHLYVNAAMERVTGIPRAHFLGKSNRELGLPAAVAARLDEAIRRVFATATRVASECEYSGPPDAARFEHIVVPELAPDGSVRSALCVGRDITERRRSDDQHRLLNEQVVQQKRQLDTVVAAMADGLVVYGPHAEILRTNATAERLLGLDANQRRLPAHERARLLQERSAAGAPFAPGASPLERALRGEAVNGEVIILDGPPPRERRWVSVSKVPIRGSDGGVAMVVASLTDVTRLHDLQEERDDLLRMISHDLRTPLSALLLQAQMLQRSLDPGDRNQKRVETIITNGQRLATMIRDLVDMVRLESGQVQLARQRVELEPFVRTLAQRLAGTLQMDRVRLSFEPALPPLSADPDRLERVLVNLTSNALKYSRPPSEVVLQTQRDGRFVRIEFIDHGIGIPADELPHLFERFFRTRDTRPQEGLGLGLYITAMLVRAHGGTIEVESEPGRGSVFRVRLPLEQQAG